MQHITQKRTAMSLMEILVAVFVLSIGLLGVISAIPIGGYAIQQAKIADRSGACGRAAIADTRVRGLVTSDRLITTGLSPKVNPQAFAIDPLMVATSSGVNNFPYWYRSSGASPVLTTGGTMRLMDRVTLQDYNTPASAPAPMPEHVARGLFVWDDQVRHTPANEDESRPAMYWKDDTNVESPAFAWYDPSITPSGDALHESTKGEFSWMLTVSPEMRTPGPSGENKSYEVSAVVHFKRDLLPEMDGDVNEAPLTERAVTCELIGGGYGGGEVRLSSDAGIHLDMENVRYIMLHGETGKTVNVSGTPVPATVCHWYRVAGYDDIEVVGGVAYRNVSLIGPDWRYLQEIPPGSGKLVLPDCTAVICPNVVGVYTTSMPAEDNPLWKTN